jgi:hypothetical protein
LQQFVAADAGRQDIAMSQLWSLTSRYAKRISGPEKFRSSARKDFFNSIGTKRTWQAGLTMSAVGGKADLMVAHAEV